MSMKRGLPPRSKGKRSCLDGNSIVQSWLSGGVASGKPMAGTSAAVTAEPALAPCGSTVRMKVTGGGALHVLSGFGRRGKRAVMSDTPASAS